MKNHRDSAFLLIVSFFVVGCTDGEFRKNQEALHDSLTQSAETALSETNARLQSYARSLLENYRKEGPCAKVTDPKPQSSVYYPKSAVLGRRADCFVAATKALEAGWRDFYEKSGYVSWIYAYDSDTRVERILPSANTRLLFGENLIFDSFSFYQEAVLNYPNLAWTKVKEDINGTGRIVIATQAVQLPASVRYATVSIDVRLSQILKDRYTDIQVFAQRNRLNHLFAFSYYKDSMSRTIISDFSNDVTIWNQLKPQDNQSLNLFEGEREPLDRLERDVERTVLSVKTREMTLRGEKYLCSLSRVRSLPVYFLVCSMR